MKKNYYTIKASIGSCSAFYPVCRSNNELYCKKKINYLFKSLNQNMRPNVNLSLYKNGKYVKNFKRI